MNTNLVKLKLWGDVGEYVGHDEWELNVKSVQEAISAINTITKNKFNNFFIKKNKLHAKYRVLINGKDFLCEEKELNENNWKSFNNSELVIKKDDLKTIDIVPLIESSGQAGGIITAILGVILIVVGAILDAFTQEYGTILIVAGVGLLGAGVVSLLSRPPTFSYNQNLDTAVSQSYLFNGPTNTVGEGNPAPIGYGTMLIGSNVISAGYKITEFQAFNNVITS